SITDTTIIQIAVDKCNNHPTIGITPNTDATIPSIFGPFLVPVLTEKYTPTICNTSIINNGVQSIDTIKAPDKIGIDNKASNMPVTSLSTFVPFNSFLFCFSSFTLTPPNIYKFISSTHSFILQKFLYD